MSKFIFVICRQVKKNDIKQKPRVNPKIRSINIDSSLIFANNLNNCKLSQQKPKERSVNRKTNAYVFNYIS